MEAMKLEAVTRTETGNNAFTEMSFTGSELTVQGNDIARLQIRRERCAGGDHFSF